MSSAPNQINTLSDSEYTTISSTSDKTVVVGKISINVIELSQSVINGFASSTERGSNVESSITSSCREPLTNTDDESSSTSQILSSVGPDCVNTGSGSAGSINSERLRNLQNNLFSENANTNIYKSHRNQLNLWRLQKRFCDVKLVCRDTIFFGHRAVLANASPFCAEKIELTKTYSKHLHEAADVVSSNREVTSCPNSCLLQPCCKTNSKNILSVAGPLTASNSTPERHVHDGFTNSVSQSKAVKISRLTVNNHLLPQTRTGTSVSIPLSSPLRTQSDCTGLIGKSKYNATRMPQHGCVECKPYVKEQSVASPAQDTVCQDETESQSDAISDTSEGDTSLTHLVRCSSHRCLHDDSSFSTPRHEEHVESEFSNTNGTTTPKDQPGNDDHMATIQIKFLSPLVLKILLEFIYTGNLHNLRNVAVDKFDEINEGAARLRLKYWVDIFEPKVIRQALTLTNFVELWDLADETCNEDLQREINFFLLQHTRELCDSELFLNLPFKKIEALLSALKLYQQISEDNIQILANSIKEEKDEDQCLQRSSKKRRANSNCLEKTSTKPGNGKLRSRAVTAFLCKHPTPVAAKQDESLYVASRDNCFSTDSEFTGVCHLANLRDKFSFSSLGEFEVKPSATCENWDVVPCEFLCYTGSNEQLTVHPLSGKESGMLASEDWNSTLHSLQNGEQASRLPYESKQTLRSSIAGNSKCGRNTDFPESRRSSCRTSRQIMSTSSSSSPGPPVQLNLVPYMPVNSTSQTLNTSNSQPTDRLTPNSLAPCLLLLGENKHGQIFTIKCPLDDDVWEEDMKLDLAPTGSPALAFLSAFTIFLSYANDTKPFDCEYTLVQQPSISYDDAAFMYDLPALTLSQRHSAAFMIGSSLFLCGGEQHGHGSLCEVESCSLSEKELCWTQIPPMRFKRANHAVVCYNGFVYVLGGSTNRCEKFDPTSKKWIEVPSLPSLFHRFQPVAAVVQDRLIVMNSFMPTHIHELKEPIGIWRCTRVVGCPPGRVLSATSRDSSVFALDDRHSICWFDMNKPTWKMVTQLNVNDFVPLQICIVDHEKEEI